MTLRILGLTLVGLGAVVVVAATAVRRRHWHDARPFVGDERGAPEPVVVPNPVVYLVYLGWLLIAAGAAALVGSLDR